MESIRAYKSPGYVGSRGNSLACISELARIRPGGLRWKNTEHQWKVGYRERECILAPAQPADWEKPPGAVSPSLPHLRLFGFLFHVCRPPQPPQRSFYAPTTHEKTCVNGGRESVVTTQVHFSLLRRIH